MESITVDEIHAAGLAAFDRSGCGVARVSVFLGGYRAGRLGRSRSSCPFPSGSGDADLWLRAHDLGRAEAGTA